jgi:hypothetical protein
MRTKTLPGKGPCVSGALGEAGAAVAVASACFWELSCFLGPIPNKLHPVKKAIPKEKLAIPYMASPGLLIYPPESKMLLSISYFFRKSSRWLQVFLIIPGILFATCFISTNKIIY